MKRPSRKRDVVERRATDRSGHERTGVWLWVSCECSGKGCGARAGSQRIVGSSRAILNELIRTLPRIKHLDLPDEDLGELGGLLVAVSELVEPVAVDDPDLRDMADRPVLGTLLACNADYLVTGDKDLLVLKRKYPIVTPAEFWARWSKDNRSGSV